MNLLKIVNCKLNIGICLIIVSWLLVFAPNEAHAGFILQRPLYIGLTNGLVGFWSFDAPTHGTSSVSDLSGNGNTGFLINGPTKAIGRIGQALSFDGSNDYVTAGTFNYGSGSYTVSGWFRTTQTTVGDIFAAFSGVNHGILIEINDGGNCNGTGVRFLHRAPTGSTGQNVCSAVSVNNGQWHHFAAVMSASTDMRLYIDGKSQAKTTPSGTLGSLHTMFGRLIDVENIRFFNGLIDEVRVYNRALSPEEVRRLYHQGATTKFNSSQKDQLKSGLVGYWNFDAMTLGTSSASDLSGNSNTGFFVNGPTKTIGRIGQALSFDGVDDYVDVANTFTPTGAVTLSAWVKKTTAQTGYKAVVSTNPYDFTDNYGIWSLGDNWYVQFNSNTATCAAITYGVWTHLVLVKDGALGRLYINGNQSCTVGVGNQTTRSLRIGDYSTPGTGPFNGLIDEVRVYNRALTDQEIRRLYNQGVSKFNASQTSSANQINRGLVGFWSFDGPDMAGVTAYDRSGQGNNGTLTNGPTKQIGKIGQALSFDGSDDYVELGTPSSLSLPGNMSASFWIKPNDVIATQTIAGQANGTVRQFKFELGRTDNAVNDAWGDAVVSISSAIFSVGNWYHVTFTRAGSTGNWTSSIYVNGILNKRTTGFPTNPSDQLNTVIGRAGSNNNSYFNGLIDEVRVYNRALSPEEVRRLYNMGR